MLANLIGSERQIYVAQIQGNPVNIAEKIVEGKPEKFYPTVCLLEQTFIKNPNLAIQDFVKTKIAELGKNIVVRCFVRYLVGEEIPYKRVRQRLLFGA